MASAVPSIAEVVSRQRNAIAEAQAAIELVHSAHRGLILSRPVSYPSEWFVRNGWRKPPVTIPIIGSQVTISGLKATIDGHLVESSTVSVDAVKSFLFLVFSEVKQKLSMPWISFGVVIGDAGEEISPFDLVEVSHAESFEYLLEAGQENHELNMIPLLVLITGCYKIHDSRPDWLKAQLQKRLEKLLAGSNYANQVRSGLCSFISSYNDREVIKIFAALDMFFNRFPQSAHATKIRFGTSILSNKHCAAIETISHLASLAQLEREDTLRWIFTRGLKEDWNRINVPAQEIHDPYSYTPYMIAFHLTGRSPFSAAANPTMHLFAHLIGCAYGSEQSINAKFFNECVPLLEVYDNAYLFIYASVRTGKLKAEAEVAQRLQLDDDNASKEKDLQKFPEPNEFDPSQWLNWTMNTNKRLASLEFVRRVVHARWAKIQQPKPKTIGEYALKLSRT